MALELPRDSTKFRGRNFDSPRLGRIAGIEAPICEQSSCKKCSFHSKTLCKCDDSCSVRGDCCKDFKSRCRRNEDGEQSCSLDADLISESRQNARYDIFECVSFQTKQGKISISTVTSCSSGNEDEGEDPGHIKDCVFNTTISHRLPVAHKNILYRNIHCLYCNRHIVDVEEKDINLYKIDFRCSSDDLGRTNISNLQKAVRNDNYYEMLQVLDDSCKVYYSPVGRSGTLISMFYPCVPNVTRKCANSSIYTLPHSTDIQTLCLAYQSLVVDIASGIIYNNFFCGLCNGLKNTSSLYCIPYEEKIVQIQLITFSFSILLDLKMKPQIAFDQGPVCIGSSYKDVTTKECVNISCQTADNNLCGLAVHGYKPDSISIQDFHQSIEITVVFNYSIVLNGDINQWLVSLFERMLERTVTPDNIGIDVLHTVLPEGNNFVVSIVPRHTRHYAWLFAFLSSRDQLQYMFLKMKSYFRDIYVGDLDNLEITNVGHNKSIICWQNEHVRLLHSFFMAINDSKVVYKMNEGGVINARLGLEDLFVIDMSNSFSIVYSISRIKVVRNIKMKDDSNLATVQSALLCDPLPRNCKLQNVHVIKHSTGEVSYACKNYYGVLGILSLVGNSLSVIGLVATLFMFMISKVRSKGVKYASCLCICLLVAQTTMLISPFTTSQVLLCRTLTVIQHVSLLSAFSVMAFISFVIHKTFSGIGNVGTTKLRSYHYATVILWPLVFVAASLILTLIPSVHFDYWRSDVCWLDPGYALLFAFAVPVAVVLLFNIICFVLTAQNMIDHKQNASFAGSSLTNVDIAKVHAKLALLMGFTWIFGFLANIKYMAFLNYIFVLLNTLQGVFIFISFVLTSKVM